MESDRSALITEPAAEGENHGRPAGAAAEGHAMTFQEESEVGATLLDYLLAMADRYRREDRCWQAMELYWRLVEEHPATPQSRVAQRSLLELAAEYDRTGARRVARGIYERLL